jgi:hypothetical protein
MTCATFTRSLACMASLACAAQLACAEGKPAPCAAAEHHQFDFWIGDWAVTEDGKPAGTNRIDRLLDGCALLENWVGVGGGRGHSLNFYDARRHTWQQTWIDASGGALNLSGGMRLGSMVMSGSRTDPATKREQIDRISWTPNADGTVRQLWDRSTDGGGSWKVLFDGLYRRRTAAGPPR